VPPVSVAITKSFPYRGVRETFSNVYTFEVPAISVTIAQDLVGRLVTVETGAHGDIVEFEEGRVWTSGGTKEQNETILITDLSGKGGAVSEPNFHAQGVYEIQWRTDRPSVTDKPVYLRKYLRAFSSYGSPSWTNGMMAGSTPISTDIKSRLQSYADNVNPLETSGGPFRLIAPSGRKVSRAPQLPIYTSIHELKY
jgi:hypothetical protein